jgi:hypothetical protein
MSVDPPRIGIVLSRLPPLLDARNIIEFIGHRSNICIFLVSGDPAWFVNRGFEVRQTNAVERSLWNSFWSLMFLAFGRLPRSVNNYFLTALYGMAHLSVNRQRWLRWILRLRIGSPNFLSFDFFVRRLHTNDDCQIDDIQSFFFFTETPCPFFFSRLVSSRKSMIAYLHSWDHACKQDTFSKAIDRYLVWSQQFGTDLESLQGIKTENIQIVGASQFSFVHDYLSDPHNENPEPPYNVDYFLFAFATFDPIQVRQEIDLVRKIATVLERIDPSLFLVLRLYPMRANQELYNDLYGLRNVIIDREFRDSTDGLIMTEKEIDLKYTKINSAKGLIHVGTTIGFEAAYFDTPVLQIGRAADFECGVERKDPLHLDRFIQAYQVKKYLLLESHPNVVTNLVELETAMRGCLERPEDYLAYNHAVRSQVPLQSLESVSHNIWQALESVAQGSV